MSLEKRFFRERYGLLIVLALMYLYSAYFTALSMQLHATFRTRASDMGQMDQALWNTLHGDWLQDTRPSGQNLPRLTDHVEPIFFVIPLVFLIYDNIASLFALQSIALALAALPIYWIARRRLQSEWAGIIFAAMYLLFPAVQAANLTEFHAVTFAPAPLMFAFNYGEERAWKRFALFMLIALGVKEDIALLVLAMGLYFAFKISDDRQQTTDKTITFHVSRFTFQIRVIPFAIALLSAIWFLAALFVIIPHFSPRNESVYIGRYPKTPVEIIAGLFVPEKATYLLKLLAPVGFLALFDPLVLLVGAPCLILNLLSSYEAQYSGVYHYSAPVAPYFVLAAIGGTAWLKQKLQITNYKLQLVLVPAFLVALGFHVVAGYTPLGGEFFFPQVTPHQQLFERFAAQIPPDAKVSTTAALFPHLSHRRVLYRFPTILDAEYVLLDVAGANTQNPIDFVASYRAALQQGFGIRDALDGYILLQRGVARKDLPDEFYNFLRACHCTLPQVPRAIDFQDKVRFLGYDVMQDDWQRVYLRLYWSRLPGMDNNFALFPFFVDDASNRRDDAALPPLAFHFWYPTLKWQGDEIVVTETTPIDVGMRAKIGVGVFFGADWDTAEFYLVPQTNLPISLDGRWVLIGEIVRQGKTYRPVESAR